MCMIRIAKLSIIVLVTLTTLGCASPFKDIRVEAQANSKVNFGGYRSYAWSVAAAVVRDPDRDWAPPNLDIAGEIEFLVNRELRARGMTEVSHAPDVLVMYAVGVDMKALDVTVDAETNLADSHSDADPGTSPRAGVMVVLVDPQTRRAVWIGRATGKVTENVTVDLAKRRLEHGITQMFADFPH